MLPIYARDRDGNVTHPFGLIDPSAFAQATRTADATGLNEIARANGLETSQLVQLLAGETPKDLEPDRLKELDLTKLGRSEEHTSELQSLMRISYAVFCLKKKQKHN